MKPLDCARGHFKAGPTRATEVPEWKDESGAPLVVYSTPITLAEKSKIAKAAEHYGGVEMLAHVLILRARTAQGELMFTIADKHALLHSVDPDVLARLARELMKAASIEEMEKN